MACKPRVASVRAVHVGLVATIAACAGVTDLADTSTPPPVTSGSPPPCVISVGHAGSPVMDPSGPYYHQVVVGQTIDGLTISGSRQVLDHASVPDAVRRADGSVFIYYVNGARGYVWVARLERDSARVLGQITVDGIANAAGIVDPDATLLPDGRVRLVYYWGFGPPNTVTTKAMCIAESSDGINFTTKGLAFTIAGSETLTDPSLLALADGTWLMAISNGQKTIMARSADGLTFTREATFSIGGVPELALAADGALRMYVCRGSIQAYRSTDAGRSWTFEQIVVSPPINGRNIVCDPSLVPGANLFVFKTG